MSIDYKKELESVARNMSLMHDTDLLIRMIVRTIIQKAKVKHVSILLYDKNKGSYILTLSKGELTARLPVGLARIDKDNSLILLFRQFHNKLLSVESIQQAIKKPGTGTNLKLILKEAIHEMDLLKANTCIPAYFRDELLGILILSKKTDNKSFAQQELDFFLALASNMAMALRNANLFGELEQELAKKHQLFMHITIALAAAIEAKDNCTHGHTARVTNLSLNIGNRLNQEDKKTFSEKFLNNLYIAALLHDVGKIGIPEHILNKKGTLTVGEWKKIKEHPVIGAKILQPIRELDEAVWGVKYHHERFDGLGYPEGLKADQIPQVASIIAVADTFDSMTSDRPYRQKLSKEEAFSKIRHETGRQLNPRIAKTFLDLCLEGKI